MKILFSYRRPFFSPVLLVSLGLHAVLFSAGAVLDSFSAKAAVREAPSSVVVVIRSGASAEVPMRGDGRQPPVRAAFPVRDQERAATEPNTAQEKRPPDEMPAVAEFGALRRPVVAFAQNPAPVYPRIARERGWEGLVVLAVFVSSDGLPVEIKVARSSGYLLLDRAAAAAVRTWRFEPAKIGPLPLTSWVRVPIRFALEPCGRGQCQGS